jgi:crotonobetainyl-CoA:carnitine CoA-transferase CaiB-like acyl-CoA transferase
MTKGSLTERCLESDSDEVRLGSLELPGTPIRITGSDPVYPTRHPIASAAAVGIGLAGGAAADVHEARSGVAQSVEIDVGHAAAAITSLDLLRLDGRVARLPAPPTTGLFPSATGRWIHLQGNLPELHAGTLAVLGLDAGARTQDIAQAVSLWDPFALEDALAERQLCGAAVRAPQEWLDHPQGRAVSTVPTVEILRLGDAAAESMPASERPLDGVRVLDLTRILAGPVCGRTLAEHGADVLNVASPKLPNIRLTEIDGGYGKRSAHLDLEELAQLRQLRALACESDVFVNNYRWGGLERRGLSPTDVAELRPGIVYVSINCYGHVGPWRGRGGWEQMAQSASGIAHVEGHPDAPRLLPVPFDDYLTGYLAAYGAMLALRRRMTEGGSWWVRASLCQTAAWIRRIGATCDPSLATGLPDDDDSRLVEIGTQFGRLRHLPPAVRMSATPPRWDAPTSPSGTSPAEWLRA